MRFRRQFFCVHVPDIISKLNNKKYQSEQNVDKVLYSTMDGPQSQNKQHGDTVPKKARDMFLCSLQINIKKSRQAWLSNAGYMCYTQTRVISHPAVAV